MELKEKEIIRKGEGENYNYSQDHCFIKLSSRNTNGELCFVEDTLKPGFYLARHHHKIMTEVFYMLSGEMELVFDDETIILKEVIFFYWWHILKINSNKNLNKFFFLAEVVTVTPKKLENGDFVITKEQLEAILKNKVIIINKFIYLVIKIRMEFNNPLEK